MAANLGGPSKGGYLKGDNSVVGETSLVGVNDVIGVKNDRLVWQREWSDHLFNTDVLWGGKGGGTDGWCSDVKEYHPYASKGINDAVLTKIINEKFPPEQKRIGDQVLQVLRAGFKVSADGSVANISSGACKSPVVAWDYSEGDFANAWNVSHPDRVPSTGSAYGLQPNLGGATSNVGDNLNYLDWDKGRADKDSNSPKEYAWQVLNRKVAQQVGWQNTFKAKTSLRTQPNESGEKRNLDTALTGPDSWSQLLGIGPSFPADDKLARGGSPVAAAVRVWRECAHKFNSLDDPRVTARQALEPYRNAANQGEYVSGSRECATEPIFQRTIPLQGTSSSQNKNCPGSAHPYKASWDNGKLGACSPHYNYFYVNDRDDQYGATSDPGDSARRSARDSDAPKAGALFKSCDDGNWCNGPVPHGKWKRIDTRLKIGKAKAGAGAANPAEFQDKCVNGALANDINPVTGKADGKTSWRYVDYLAQMAYLYTEGQRVMTNSMSVENHSSVVDLNGNLLYSYSWVTAPQFADLFTWWNPLLPKVGIRMSPLTDPTQPAGWPPIVKDSPQENADAACRLFSEWLALDWKVQNIGTGRNRVTVALNPIPNRLYAVQVVYLDRAENIVDQYFQFMASPASGDLPVPDSKYQCPKDSPFPDKEITNPDGLSADQIKEQCGQPPREKCQDARQQVEGVPAGPPIYYDVVDGNKPEECNYERRRTSPAYPPLPSGLDFLNPNSQLTGQSWAAGLGFGEIRSEPSGGSLPELPDDGGTPVGSPRGDTGVWMPRAARYSVFNPGNHLKSLDYKKTHRPQLQKDSSEGSLDRFFKTDTGASRVIRDSEVNDVDAPETRSYFQAEIPLESPAFGNSRNAFGSNMKMAVSNPTRNYDEDADKGLSEGQMQKLRGKVDESRFATVIGEGHYPAFTSTATRYESGCSPSSPSCLKELEVQPTDSEWHRLTADKCEGATYLPRIQTPGSRIVGECNPEASVGGDGWKVKDAYRIPAQQQDTSIALAASFNTDVSQSGAASNPAMLRLDSSDISSLKGRISSIEIWDRGRWLNRSSSTQPSYKLMEPIAGTPGADRFPTTKLNLCTPIDPYKVWVQQARPASPIIGPAGASLPHYHRDWPTVTGMMTADPKIGAGDDTPAGGWPDSNKWADNTTRRAHPGDSALRNTGWWWHYNDNFYANGVGARRYSNWWVSRNSKGDLWAAPSKPPSSGWTTPHNMASRSETDNWGGLGKPTGDIAPSWASVRDAFRSKGYTATDNGRKIFLPYGSYGNVLLRRWANGDEDVSPGSWMGRYLDEMPWNTVSENWSPVEQGQSWWFQPEDLGSTELFRQYPDEYRWQWVEANGPNIGKCQDQWLGKKGSDYKVFSGRNRGDGKKEAAEKGYSDLQELSSPEDADGSPNYPNANILSPSGSIIRTAIDPSTGLPVNSDNGFTSRALPADEWVVVYRLANPPGAATLPAVSSWGILGHFTANKSTKWVSRFDLTQEATRTSIYRYRPTG